MLILNAPYAPFVFPFDQWDYLKDLSGNNLEDFYTAHLLKSENICKLIDEIERINPEKSRTGMFVCEVELNLVKNVFWKLKIYWIEPIPDGHTVRQICELHDTEIQNLNYEQIITLFKDKLKQGLEKIIGEIEEDIIEKKHEKLNFLFALKSLS